MEDDEGLRQALGRLLLAAGYEFESHASGEAMIASGLGDAACLVLDVSLPGMSGFELNDRLSKTGARVPVIFITAHDTPANRQRAQQCGSRAFLVKPVPGRTLIDSIRTTLADE